MKSIVTIGGGSGHAQVLKALKGIPDISITAICPSTDSGGSTGVLRESYAGHGYIGDLTKCVAALAPDPVIASMLMYRYGPGELEGHSVKNILFHALEMVSDLDTALTQLERIAAIAPHHVLPVATEYAELCATLRLGNTIAGETNIDTLAHNPLWNPTVHAITDIYLKPPITAFPRAVEAVAHSDHVIICPGDLYSSIIPVLLPHGMREALSHSRAPITVITNIMTKSGETDAYTADVFIKKIEERIGRHATSIVCNNAPIPEQVRLNYLLESKVELGALMDHDKRVIAASLAALNERGQLITDPITLRAILVSIIDP